MQRMLLDCRMSSHSLIAPPQCLQMRGMLPSVTTLNFQRNSAIPIKSFLLLYLLCPDGINRPASTPCKIPNILFL